jgi:hypothetical protein
MRLLRALEDCQMPNDEIFELFMFKLEALELDYTVHINVKLKW